MTTHRHHPSPPSRPAWQRHAALSRRCLMQATGALAAGAALACVPAARAQDATELPFWLPGGSPLFCETHQAIAADFLAANPEISVMVECGTGQDNFQERFLAAIAGGNAPEGSVIWDTPVSYGVQGALLDLTDLMPMGEYTPVANWPAEVLASCQFGDATYGLPYTAGTYGLYYNQAMLAEKGIPTDAASFPKTWAELRRLSAEVVEWDGDKLVTAGFIPRTADMDYTLPIWSALNGSQIYDAANQQYTIDSEQNVEMMQFFLDWLDEQYRGDIALVAASAQWHNYPDAEGRPPQFQLGNMMVVESGTWALGDFYEAGVEDPITEWDIASYPTGPSGEAVVSGYWPNWLVIPANTDHPELMFRYLDYLSGVGVIEMFNLLPDIPTNTLVPETVPTGIVGRRGEEFAEHAITFFRNQLGVATAMWDSPVQSFAIDQLRGVIDQTLSKQLAPADALAEAQLACQNELESVLRRNG